MRPRALELRSVLAMGSRNVWAHTRTAVRGVGNRGIGGLVLLVSLASIGPVPIHAAEAGIDVPMRRGVGTTFRDVSDAAAAPDDVLAATEWVRHEIGILRQEFGVDDYPARAESHANRRLAHVYVKAQEVMMKVVAAQRRMGVQEGLVPEMPLSGLTSEDVMAAVESILGGIRAIKTQMVIESTAEPPVISGPQTLSAAYRNLADSSAMLDGLVGQSMTPADVFRHVRAVIDDMTLIAAKLEVPLDENPPEISGAKESVDVAQQALRAAYKVVVLQNRLGMDASAVPTLTMVRVTPAEAYDLTGILRAELARIKWNLGINVPASDNTELASHRDFADVFAQMLLVVRHLEQLATVLEN